MPRILILSGLQISTNPRVVKEANALSDAGYDVEVAGAVLNPRLVSHDEEILQGSRWRWTPLVDASSPRTLDQLRWFWSRARGRVSRSIAKSLAVATPLQLGYVPHEMLSTAMARRADLVILHNPQSIWVGKELILSHQKVAVDFEDWYSEDLLPQDRSALPIASLKQWERFVLANAAYATTTSHSMSSALSHEYECALPLVVFNTFPPDERARLDGAIRDRVDPAVPSLVWFSQVVGPGRGLELLMQAISMIHRPLEVHIRGAVAESYRNNLLNMVSDAHRHRVRFHSPVRHSELLSRIAEHDIGYAGEIPYCRSRDLTITNKILQYLQAGVAVVASDTSGQREVASKCGGAVSLFKSGDATSLAQALETFLDPEIRERARVKALAAAETHFSWQASVTVLRDKVREALSGTRASTIRGMTP